MPARLLGRHVGDRAHRAARAGQFVRRGSRFQLIRLTGAAEPFHLRQAKVENLGLPSRRDENVGRLDIAVHDAFGVSGFQSVGNLNSEGQQLLHLHHLAPQELGQ